MTRRPHNYRRPRRWRTTRLRGAPLIALAVILVGLKAWDQLAATGSWSGRQEIRPTVIRGGDAWNGVRPSEGTPRNAPHGRELTGPTTHVRDGDTIEISGVPVRIANLDCAEMGTAAGRRATARMRELVRSGDISCTLSGRRSYDRQVGTCRVPGGHDIGEVLIAEGFCARWQ